MADLGNDYLERVVTLGESRGLVGVLTVPVGRRQPDAPCVLLLNSGVLHRVGANRVHVRLARALAEIGVVTLRFDLSGVGDSGRRREATSIRQSVERDIRDAVDHLARDHGAAGFVLMGLCSGAFDAMHAAIGDERVVGAVMVDIPGPFQTWRFVAHRVGDRILYTKNWRRTIENAAPQLRAFLTSLVVAKQRRGDGYVEGGRSSVSRDQMGSQLDSLLARGVRLLVIFTPGVETNYNHRSLFRTTFPRAAAHTGLEYDYFEDADHAFSKERERQRLVARVVRWISAWSARAGENAKWWSEFGTPVSSAVAPDPPHRR